MTRFVLGLAILIASNLAVAQTAPTVTVRNLTLVNLTQVPVEDYQQIVQFALDNKDIPATPDVVAERVHYALQDRGYFRAEVGDPEMKVISQSPTEKIVDVVVQIDPGALYALDAIQFRGNYLRGNYAAPVFPEEQLRTQFAISDGDLFDTEKIRVGLENLRKLYAEEGYINFTPVPNTDVLDQTRSVRLVIDLDEGKRFYFGDSKVTPAAEQSDAVRRLVSDWSFLKGRLYSQSEVDELAKRHPELAYKLAIRQNAQAGTVTLELRP